MLKMANTGSIGIAFLAIFSFSILLETSIVIAQDDKVIFCYWGTWSFYKPGHGNFKVEDIDPFLCTHIIYSFMGLRDNEPDCLDPWLDLSNANSNHWCNHKILDDPNQVGNWNYLREYMTLKTANPDLKLLIGIGGWNVDPVLFSNMSKDISSMTHFAGRVKDLIDEFGFDGIDLDWEYPTQRGGVPEDKENFVTLLQTVRQHIGPDKVFSIAIGLSEKLMQEAYDFPGISQSVDFVLMMAYDFKMFLPNVSELVGHHSPIYPKASEDQNNTELTIQWSVDNVLRHFPDPSKLVLGVGAYGKTFTIDGPENSNFYDKALGPGHAFTYTQENGTAAYYEICSETRDKGYTLYFDNEYKSPYMHNGETWIGYDNGYSTMEKVDFAMSRNLRGMMVWSLDMDDTPKKNICGGHFPLPIIPSMKYRLDSHKSKRKNV